MTVSMTIRDVPDETRDVLAARAAREGQSLQEYVRARLVELVRRPTAAELWDRVEHRLQSAGTQLPAEEILGLRADDRR
jgi:plasmid stability protein